MQQNQAIAPIVQLKFHNQDQQVIQQRRLLQIPQIQIVHHQIQPSKILQLPQIQVQNPQVQQQPQHKPHPKSKFTPEEDILLRQLVSQFGENNWNRIAELMPHRNMRQCKERWTNYLSPKVSNDPWTEEEDALLVQKYKEHGAKWVRIALSFPKRTDSNVKNRWLVLSRRSKKIDHNSHAVVSAALAMSSIVPTSTNIVNAGS